MKFKNEALIWAIVIILGGYVLGAAICKFSQQDIPCVGEACE